MENLKRAKIRDSEDFVFIIEDDTPSKYVEGEEYVKVKRSPEDKEPKYIKRKSLVLHWR